MTESAPKRIVVFAAHGDDLEFTCGGTIAKLTDRGHQVALVVATHNDIVPQLFLPTTALGMHWV